MAFLTFDQPQVTCTRPVNPCVRDTFARTTYFGQSDEGWGPVARSLRALISLTDNWDGLGAAAPAPGVVATAMDVAAQLRKGRVELPNSALATPAGTILFEWSDGQNYMELEVINPNLLEWMTIDGEGATRHGAIPWRNVSAQGDLFGR